MTPSLFAFDGCDATRTAMQHELTSSTCNRARTVGVSPTTRALAKQLSYGNYGQGPTFPLPALRDHPPAETRPAWCRAGLEVRRPSAAFLPRMRDAHYLRAGTPPVRGPLAK